MIHSIAKFILTKYNTAARPYVGLFVVLGLTSFVFIAAAAVDHKNRSLLAGQTTVTQTNRNAFSLPSANLPISKRDQFFIGNAFFTKPWVSAPASTTARDGLGPIFITNACQSCHVKDGRGRPPIADDEDFRALLVRLSVADTQRPDPVYGDQLQNRSIEGVLAEADPRLEYEYFEGEFADGTAYQLRKPILRIDNWAYGEPEQELATSLRVAPAMIGLGLLEAIDEQTLLGFADPQDEDNDGISGKINLVAEIDNSEKVIGRFGWKAEQPTVKQQVAAAFNGDMGLTTSLFPEQPCTPKQQNCLNRPHGGEPEVPDNILDTVVFYSHHLAVPAQRNADKHEVIRGAELFNQAGCSGCHKTDIQTGASAEFPELGNQLIHPYTDLLLHDMGEGLADNRQSFEATGQEWRTPPLWGIGLVETVNDHTFFLHDGRARNLMEAILWHGGEAEVSKSNVLKMSLQERQNLIEFLQSL